MSVDIVNREHKAKEDITWDDLISASETEIEACKDKIETLRKSLIYFKKQKESGTKFPLARISRHKKAPASAGAEMGEK